MIAVAGVNVAVPGGARAGAAPGGDLGSSIDVVERDAAALSVKDAHLAMADRHLGNRDRVAAVANHERLATGWSTPLQHRLDAS